MPADLKPHISIQDLTVWYGPHRALNHISIDIPDRKITAIIGPSGCGKTTLLKALNRLVELQEGIRVSGQVLIDGEDIYHPTVEVTHLRKKVGLLLQRPQVLPMSIYDNVAYGPRVHGVRDRRGLDALVERQLQEAGLWSEVKDRLHGPAARLSIGQQQRLCLARALAVEPEVILGDEPTSALDPISAERIEQRLSELKARYTIVLVTHSLRQAKRLADHVIFLYMGDLIEYGPADHVLNQPKYLKTQNYLSGRFIEEPPVDKLLDLRGRRPDPAAVTQLLGGLEIGRVLKVTVESPEALRQVQTAVEAEGHLILEIRRLDLAEWDVVIQKKGGMYTI